MARTLCLLLVLMSAACTGEPEPAATIPMTVDQTTEPADPIESLSVVTLGDSLAFGAGDESGGGIAVRLERELTSRGVAEVSAINLGRNGARTDEVTATLKGERVQRIIGSADAVVLSVGANDLFRTEREREETFQAPLAVAEQILARIEGIVAEIHTLNPDARVVLLGGYNPVPRHPLAGLIEHYLELWDLSLARAFEGDTRVSVVRMRDIVAPERLSRHDSFHPGGDAYQQATERIASLLLSPPRG